MSTEEKKQEVGKKAKTKGFKELDNQRGTEMATRERQASAKIH